MGLRRPVARRYGGTHAGLPGEKVLRCVDTYFPGASVLYSVRTGSRTFCVLCVRRHRAACPRAPRTVRTPHAYQPRAGRTHAYRVVHHRSQRSGRPTALTLTLTLTLPQVLRRARAAGCAPRVRARARLPRDRDPRLVGFVRSPPRPRPRRPPQATSTAARSVRDLGPRHVLGRFVRWRLTLTLIRSLSLTPTPTAALTLFLPQL